MVRRKGPYKTGPYKKRLRRNLLRLPRTKTRIRDDVGSFIQRARRAAGLTQVALGARIGVEGRAVMRWENGRAAPTRRNFEALVAHLRTIKPDVATWLWGEATGEKAPAPPAPSISALRAAVLQLTDELDASPRRTREALSRLLTKLRTERFTLEAAHAALDAWSAETREAFET